MSEAYIEILTLTGTAPSAVSGNRFVGFNDAQASVAGQPCKGVAYSDAGTGEIYPIHAAGVTTVVSGAAVAIGAALQTDAQGRAVTQSSGVLVARALEAATAADQLIQVLLK
jgi:hypothetical protein